jgi:hypothetical protein
MAVERHLRRVADRLPAAAAELQPATMRAWHRRREAVDSDQRGANSRCQFCTIDSRGSLIDLTRGIAASPREPSSAMS